MGAPSFNNRRIGCGPVALAVVGLVVLIGAFAFFRPDRSARDRVEVEHSITLPLSAREIQALGDASGSVWAVLGIDRGASSIMVIDRVDVEALLAEFDFDPDQESANCFGGGGGPAPGNSVYQPSVVPWPEENQAKSRYSTSTPPGSADIACLYMYELDDPDSVGVWIYSDWN